jgi:cation:H+ antiporter
MLFDILIFFISIPILVYFSDVFIDNTAKLAKSFGVSHFVIGITVVGIGTSLPEIIVADYASFTNESGIVLGNIIGSNVTNISLILGVAFFIRKSVIDDDHMYKDSIIHLLILGFGVIIILTDNTISRLEGVILTGMFVSYILHSLKSHKIPEKKDDENTLNGTIVLYTIIGIVGVLIGSKLLVESAVAVANELNVSSAVIALTIIALGTSLPELTVSISAASRGFTMLILGNIVGSNITNMALAMGTASMIRDVLIEDARFIMLNLVYMMLLSIILVVIIRKKNISRLWGGLYLIMYGIFVLGSYTMS